MTPTSGLPSTVASTMRTTPHPDIVKVLEALDALDVPNFYKTSPEEARAIFRGIRPKADVWPNIYYTQNHRVNLKGAEILIREYRPNDENNLPALMWYHGGGWVVGDTVAGEMACRDLANQANCAVFSVDYRLAPEHTFPTAFEDCVAATEWVKENGNRLNIDIGRLAVGGDSAGGNLAAAVAQHGRDNGLNIQHQLLIYPVTQPDLTTQSYIDNADGYFLSTASMQWFWDQYVPNAAERTDPRAAPLMGDLRRLPSSWVFTCGFDPLCDDGVMYAKAMQENGVPVETYHQDDAIHGVFGMAIGPGKAARTQAAASLRNAFQH